ncbi:PD-(D/E)XK nuclease family protein [Conexibacter stalactiti]|uniref:PD-(D/E)XK nuclease family protein n=1 Tax=Conexibacter stalactiti TaxID=1940611 RepID=A0ABU4HQ83_9ACTN|nr:PD-(D/E)XK nuclease family protein [Conexibacter stalactiti]MDW5594199.1 PD-(D/E)XK nuclease family protein [Conexibacter stalactiti]MEC5034841.1 PD-(D/E)XK nuclease family protein [Conexibacter stalactiti]
MPLKLITGPANAAKAGAALGAFRGRLRRDPWLVVPNAADVAYFEAELAEGIAVRRGGHVVTFPALVRELARRAGYAARVVTPLQRERLVADAIAQAPLEALAPIAGTRGFLHAAGAFTAEMERSLLTPQRLTAAVRALPEAPATLHEVAAIYDRFARGLERLQRVDGDLFAWRALDALRARPSAWGETPVVFYGFDDFTRIELDAIETLGKVVGADVLVSLTFEPGRNAFASRARFAEELAQIADEVERMPPLDDWYDDASRGPLHALERGLFEPAAFTAEPGDAAALLVAGGERAEAELVAAEVLRLLGAGVPGDEIAVVLRTPARTASLLEQVFGAYGIPHALDWRVPLSHTALGRGLLALARCALLPDEARPADLLAYLRTPGRLNRLELADRLELTVRRHAIVRLDGARAAWEEAPGGWPLRELDRLRGAAADGPAALLGALAREARALFVAPHRGAAHVLDPSEEADARALAALLRALEELGELAAAEPRRAAELLGPEPLLAALGELEVSLGEPPRAGAVLVSDPLGIRARRFDTVIVCGLQEGEFPRPAHPEPFLSDDVRRELNTVAGLRLAPREDALADERYLFYATVSRPRRRLLLSTRDADEDGNPALPSFFVDDVRAVLPGLPERHRPLSAVTWPLAQAPTEAERLRAEALAAPRVEPRPIASLSAAATARLRQREVLSAGALEKYARCPVRWFVESELQPARFEPDPEAMTRGSCIHAVLERSLAQLDWPLPLDRFDEVEAVVRAAVAIESPRWVLGRGAAAQAAAAHEIVADVLRLLRHEAEAGGAFKPAELELQFGMGAEDGLPALELRAAADGPAAPGAPEAEPLRLRGVIDRVDLDLAGRALVRDYKSGRPGRGWAVANWRAEDQLQVALYMVVVRELLRREPAGGVYQPLRGEELRPRGLVRADVNAGSGLYRTDRRSEEELEEELAAAAERACQLAARLRAGLLEPSPDTCGRDGCAYPGICRVVDQ